MGRSIKRSNVAPVERGGKLPLAPKAIAREVIALTLAGKKVNKAAIQEKHGYSKQSARSGQGTRSKIYKKEIASFVERMERERDRLLQAMSDRHLELVEYNDMSNALDRLTKNVELLSGRDTARVGGLVDDIFDKL